MRLDNRQNLEIGGEEGVMRCIPWTEEVYDDRPVHCPQCGSAVTDFLWFFQTQYYCSPNHVPPSKGSNYHEPLPTPRLATGAIDWERHYADFYGRAPRTPGEEAS